jgi:hypothetical protein
MVGWLVGWTRTGLTSLVVLWECFSVGTVRHLHKLSQSGPLLRKPGQILRHCHNRKEQFIVVGHGGFDYLREDKGLKLLVRSPNQRLGIINIWDHQLGERREGTVVHLVCWVCVCLPVQRSCCVVGCGLRTVVRGLREVVGEVCTPLFFFLFFFLVFQKRHKKRRGFCQGEVQLCTQLLQVHCASLKEVR